MDDASSVRQAPSAVTLIGTLALLVAGSLLAGTGALWAHYGTAVFVETILAGLAACF